VKLAVILLVLASLAACGSSDQSGYADAASVAKAAGCAQIQAEQPPTLYATDEVQCRHAGQFVLVDWFKDGDSLANFKDASSGGGYVILYGSDWAISCVDDKNSCTAIQDEIGGSLG
jgi:hypothetical protein